MPSLAEDFDGFWLCYPRREARIRAFKAYAKARTMASAADILAGVERYKLTMPEERRYRPLPASWLNDGRWMDEDDAPVIAPKKEFWGDECDRVHNGRCVKQWDHAMKMRESA